MQEVDAGFQVLKAILPETLANPELGVQINEQIYASAFASAEAYIQHLIEQGNIAPLDPAMATRLFASPLLGLMFLRLMGDEHVKANWQAYSEAMSNLLIKGFQTKDQSSDENDPLN
ncbi:TetR/AcrR family transcriptional regulator C-terminal domain-containing protein [Chloroflexi bacterium TSY]|nr:TetR/AcrR family transcriptional regulator C-terminal domain-containing protein [Chloroflexi bacterium TSY]